MLGYLGLASGCDSIHHGQFGWIHQIAFPSENELWVGELLNWRVQHLMLHPVKQATGN